MRGGRGEGPAGGLGGGGLGSRTSTLPTWQASSTGREASSPASHHSASSASAIRSQYHRDRSTSRPPGRCAPRPLDRRSWVDHHEQAARDRDGRGLRQARPGVPAVWVGEEGPPDELLTDHRRRADPWTRRAAAGQPRLAPRRLARFELGDPLEGLVDGGTVFVQSPLTDAAAIWSSIPTGPRRHRRATHPGHGAGYGRARPRSITRPGPVLRLQGWRSSAHSWHDHVRRRCRSGSDAMLAAVGARTLGSTGSGAMTCSRRTWRWSPRRSTASSM